MARSEARLLFGVMDGLRGLTTEAKLLYFALLVEPTVNQAGVGALRESRWAKETELPIDVTRNALRELNAARYVIIDYDTEEVFIRSHIRNDGVTDQPNVLWAACRAAEVVQSRRVRHELALELRRLPPKPPDKVTKSGRTYVHPDPHEVADKIDPGPPPDPQGEPFENPSGTQPEPFENPSRTHPEPCVSGTLREPFENPQGIGVGDRGKGSTPVATQVSKSKPCAAQTVEPEPPPAADAASGDAPRPRSKRGTRIPDEFATTPDMASWARQHTPNLDERLETEIFIDYWRAKPGKDAEKLDWVLTWKNWLRREQKKATHRSTARPSVATADRRIAEAELLKDNPNPSILAAAGIPMPPRLKALPGGAA